MQCSFVVALVTVVPLALVVVQLVHAQEPSLCKFITAEAAAHEVVWIGKEWL